MRSFHSILNTASATLLAAAVALSVAGVVTAAPITYMISGLASGSLGTTAYVSQPLTLSLTSDTTAVMAGSFAGVGVTYNVTPATVASFTWGASSGTFLNAFVAGSYQTPAGLAPYAPGGDNVLVIGENLGGGFVSSVLYTTTGTPSLYDMVSNFSFTGPGDPLGYLPVGPFETDIGDLTIDSIDSTVTFTAITSAVPEIDPAGMGSVIALVSGALGLLERRRRAFVAA